MAAGIKVPTTVYPIDHESFPPATFFSIGEALDYSRQQIKPGAGAAWCSAHNFLTQWERTAHVARHGTS